MYIFLFRAYAGQDAYQMAAEKPEILEVLNNPPEVHLFEFNSVSSLESLQNAVSPVNSIGRY